MKYKLLATDIDGTLLDNDSKLSRDNIEALKKAEACGVKVVLCSGRSHIAVKVFADEIPINGEYDYLIGFSGGILCNAKSSEILYEARLDKNIALEIITKARAFDVAILVYFHEQLVIEQENKHTDYYVSRSRLAPKKVDSFDTFLVDDVSKVLLFGDREEVVRAKESLKDVPLDASSIFFSHENLLEFNPPNATKGTTLKRLADQLNIDMSEVIAVGDNFNDISMITMAGLGVAVANAEQEVKNIADYITDLDNNKSALKEVVEKFILTN